MSFYTSYIYTEERKLLPLCLNSIEALLIVSGKKMMKTVLEM